MVNTNRADEKSTSESIGGLSAEEIDLRKRWLEFAKEDEDLLGEIDGVIGQHLEKIIAAMYDHFFSFEETKAFFPDAATLNRARSAQHQYFIRLTKGQYDAEYVRDRLRIGATHYRVDLDPKWYIGAYNRVLSRILPLLAAHWPSDPEKLTRAFSALLKIVFFDMGLAIETYISAKESAIRKHRDAIAELETERRVTKDILENAPVGIVRLNEEFVVLECNEAFGEMIGGGERGGIIGQRLFDIVPDLSRAPFESALSTGHPYQCAAEPLPFVAAWTTGQTFWDWAVWAVKDKDGVTSGLVALFVSATDRVLLQQQREDFVATLTHDLKTPILAANRAVRLLCEGDFGPVSEPQARILDTIHQSNEALYKMVQTLLDVYRYDSGAKELNLGWHNLAETVRRLVAELKPLAESKGISLMAQLPAAPREVLCDEAEIRRVIQNLLDNSLKFTPAGGTISVEIAESETKTTIRVSDTGKGVSEEDMPKLFQRFWQAASSGRYYASTGLGLYLCRKIVELHKGQIWCDSKPGKGSTFAFTIGDLSDRT
ncbi:MAG TPA: protoglobin domain-containing protein [Candidatus Obscuribacterales bacterium]